MEIGKAQLPSLTWLASCNVKLSAALRGSCVVNFKSVGFTCETRKMHLHEFVFKKTLTVCFNFSHRTLRFHSFGFRKTFVGKSFETSNQSRILLNVLHAGFPEKLFSKSLTCQISRERFINTFSVKRQPYALSLFLDNGLWTVRNLSYLLLLRLILSDDVMLEN